MTIVEINRERFFSREEASAILPIIIKITESYSQKVHELIDRMEKVASTDPGLARQIEGEVDQLIKQWQGKVQKLGANPKGLWIADFDTGDGFFCWKYPETKIDYWHSYQDGFSKRQHLSQHPRQTGRETGQNSTKTVIPIHKELDNT